MSKQKSTGSRPLPSFLSNIRNAVQTAEIMSRKDANRNNEFLPLIVDSEDNGISNSMTKPSSPLSPGENQKTSLNSLMKRFEITNISRLGRSQRSRFGFRGKDRKDASAKRGFHVQMPTEIILYVIIIFFVVPLLVGLYVLIRELLIINPRPKKPENIHNTMHFHGHNTPLVDKVIDITETNENDTKLNKTVFSKSGETSIPKDEVSEYDKTEWSISNETEKKETIQSEKSGVTL